MNTAIKSIDNYIAGFPDDTRELLEQLRSSVIKTAVGAEEMISYKMPAFKLNGRMLVWYAAYEKHIGLYPTASPIPYFREELAGYKFSKGAIQFPLNKPLPIDLITKIVNFKLNEILAKPVIKTKVK
jgi:uncharacterized protein YdhG (YjbR/CyaY superfamily)